MTFKKFVILILTVAFLLNFAAYGKDNTAEKAGKKIANSVEKAGKKIDQAADDAGKKVGKAAKKVDKAAKKAEKKVKDLFD